MGIEYDRAGVVVAYHLRRRNVKPSVNVYPETDYLRFPADDILHLHLTEYAEQARGVPWGHSAMRRLNMTGKYEEFELVAAALGASKMGFYYSEDGDGASPDDIQDDSGDEYDDGEVTQKIEAGLIQQLAEGTRFEGFDPTHPTTAFDGFMRAVLRGASSGLDVAYHGLSNDLENVNFSSIRSGVIAERDSWRCLQGWLIDHMLFPIYQRWLPTSILNGRLPLPFRKVDTKFQNIKWQPRGWSWVDPKKDSDAAMQNIRMGLETRENVLAQQGRDIEEVFQQLARENDRAAFYKINIDHFDKAISEADNDEEN